MSKAKLPLLWAIFTSMVFLACGEISDPSGENIDISAKSIDFGTIPLGSRKDTAIILTNIGKVDIVISASNSRIRQGTPGSFMSSFTYSSRFFHIIKPNETEEIFITFYVSTTGVKIAELEIVSDIGVVLSRISLIGKGI